MGCTCSGVSAVVISSAIGTAMIRMRPIAGMLAFRPGVILPCVNSGSSRIAIEPTTAIDDVQA